MDSVLPVSHGVVAQTTSITVAMAPSGVGFAFANAVYPFNLKNWLNDGSLYVVDSVSVRWSAPDWEIVEALGSQSPVLTLVRSRDFAPVGRGTLPIVTDGQFSPLSVAQRFQQGDDLELHCNGVLGATPNLQARTTIQAYVQLRVVEVLDKGTQDLIDSSYGGLYGFPKTKGVPGGGSRVRLVSEGAESHTFEERPF